MSSRLDAVWAAAYVAVLSSAVYSVTFPGHEVVDRFSVAIGEPSPERIRIAIETADAAVAQLEKELTKRARARRRQ